MIDDVRRTRRAPRQLRLGTDPSEAVGGSSPTGLEVALDEVWRRAGDTPIPKPRQSTTTLLDVLVSASRRDDSSERRLYFAKHVAALLIANDGAREDVVQRALDGDEYIQAIAPGVTAADLKAMSRVHSSAGDRVPSAMLAWPL